MTRGGDDADGPQETDDDTQVHAILQLFTDAEALCDDFHSGVADIAEGLRNATPQGLERAAAADLHVAHVCAALHAMYRRVGVRSIPSVTLREEMLYVWRLCGVALQDARGDCAAAAGVLHALVRRAPCMLPAHVHLAFRALQEAQFGAALHMAETLVDTFGRGCGGSAEGNTGVALLDPMALDPTGVCELLWLGAVCAWKLSGLGGVRDPHGAYSTSTAGTDTETAEGGGVCSTRGSPSCPQRTGIHNALAAKARGFVERGVAVLVDAATWGGEEGREVERSQLRWGFAVVADAMRGGRGPSGEMTTEESGAVRSMAHGRRSDDPTATPPTDALHAYLSRNISDATDDSHAQSIGIAARYACPSLVPHRSMLNAPRRAAADVAGAALTPYAAIEAYMDIGGSEGGKTTPPGMPVDGGKDATRGRGGASGCAAACGGTDVEATGTTATGSAPTRPRGGTGCRGGADAGADSTPATSSPPPGGGSPHRRHRRRSSGTQRKTTPPEPVHLPRQRKSDCKAAPPPVVVLPRRVSRAASMRGEVERVRRVGAQEGWLPADRACVVAVALAAAAARQCCCGLLSWRREQRRRRSLRKARVAEATAAGCTMDDLHALCKREAQAARAHSAALRRLPLPPDTASGSDTSHAALTLLDADAGAADGAFPLPSQQQVDAFAGLLRGSLFRGL